MRLAVITTAVLALITQFNSPQPILEPHRVAHSDSVVVSFMSDKKVEFPDRTVEYTKAKEADIEKAEIERVRALEAQKQAQVQAQAQSVPNTPVLSSDDAFIQLSYCEAGGKPATNTGNGYYGMFQYDLQTWANYMGYARPDLAPAEVQLAKAKETQARRGWSPWPSCARKLGLM